TLSDLTVPAGFAIVQDFTSTALGSGDSATFILGVDSSAAGALSGEVSFTNSDPNENPYTFTVSATVQDTTAPVASIAVIPNVNAVSRVDFTVQVTYTDLSKIDASSIDKNDLVITGPGTGFPLTPTSVETTELVNGSPLVVTYRFFQQGTSVGVARKWR